MNLLGTQDIVPATDASGLISGAAVPHQIMRSVSP